MAKISISNLAWNKKDDKHIFRLMKQANVFNLEISPFRDFTNEAELTKKSASMIRSQLNPYGIKVVALQSLMYRFPDLSLFTNDFLRKKTFDHMVRIINFANFLGAKVLVFGCPKNKLRKKLKYDKALRIATEFFKRLAKHLSKFNMVCCIEPTPTIYGADFVRSTKEAVTLIKAVNNDFIKLNFDLGTLKINNKNIEKTIFEYYKYIGHIHISEPSLKSIEIDYSFHKKFAQALKDMSYEKFVSIEMLPVDTNNTQTIQAVLSFISEVYNGSI